MKKKDVRIGGVYEAKVSGKLARVKIDYECSGGGWMGTNLDTKHSVRVRTAGRLRKPVSIAPPTSAADLYRQWQRLKESNPGTVLLFRVADCFEVYGDDATACISILDLKPAEKVTWDGCYTVSPLQFIETSVARFPDTDLQANITKLVAAGHRVAICERVTPGEAKGKPVEKIVIPVPSNGTLLDTVRHKEEVTEGLIQAAKKS